jgi:hypothetical protein
MWCLLRLQSAMLSKCAETPLARCYCSECVITLQVDYTFTSEEWALKEALNAASRREPSPEKAAPSHFPSGRRRGRPPAHQHPEAFHEGSAPARHDSGGAARDCAGTAAALLQSSAWGARFAPDVAPHQFEHVPSHSSDASHRHAPRDGAMTAHEHAPWPSGAKAPRANGWSTDAHLAARRGGPDGQHNYMANRVDAPQAHNGHAGDAWQYQKAFGGVAGGHMSHVDQQPMVHGSSMLWTGADLF